MAKSTSKYFNSNRKVGLAKKRTVAHGPAGHGKTWFAAQLDPSFPKTVPAKKWVKLKSTLWVLYDAGGLDGLLDNKIEVDYVDPYEILKDHDLIDGQNVMFDLLYKMVKENGYKHVVFDTITRYDKDLNAYWDDDENCPKTKQGAKDSFGVWRAIGNTHKRFHDDADGLPCDVTFLMHSKAMSESASLQKKGKAASTPGSSDFVIDFKYYDMGNTYRANASIIAAIHTIKEPKGKKRYAFLESGQGADEEGLGFEAKNRFQSSLPDGKYPADLGLLYSKIEANLKK
jgi:hypothetical protein